MRTLRIRKKLLFSFPKNVYIWQNIKRHHLETTRILSHNPAGTNIEVIPLDVLLNIFFFGNENNYFFSYSSRTHPCASFELLRSKIHRVVAEISGFKDTIVFWKLFNRLSQDLLDMLLNFKILLMYSPHHRLFLVDSKHLKQCPRTRIQRACIRRIIACLWWTVNI